MFDRDESVLGRSVILTYPGALDEAGGGVTHLVSLARQFAHAGVAVTVVPARPASGSFMDVSKLRLDPSRGSRVHYLLDGIGVARRVRQLARRDAVHAVLGWGPELAFIPLAFPIRRKRPLVAMIAAGNYKLWSERDTSTPWLLRRLVDEFFRWAPLRRADIVFVSSKHTVGEVQKVARVAPQRIVLARCGVDSRFFDVVRKNEPGEPVHRILFFGAVNEVKGVFDLIEALRLVARPDLEVRMAGWGDIDAARRAAEAAGVGGQLRFVGSRDHDQLRADLAWAQLALLPSRTESFGLAIAEAQAAGVPVISTTAGSIPEVVDDGVTGWLVPPADPVALAEAISEAVADPSATAGRGAAAREHVRRQFSWERTVDVMLDTLQGLRRPQ